MDLVCSIERTHSLGGRRPSRNGSVVVVAVAVVAELCFHPSATTARRVGRAQLAYLTTSWLEPLTGRSTGSEVIPLTGRQEEQRERQGGGGGNERQRQERK